VKVQVKSSTSLKYSVLWDIARRVVTLKLTDVSEVLTAFIIRAMMEAVRSSETFVNFSVTTRRYIPEDFILHNLRRENLKSH
jgi:hypothetical protein